MPGRDALQGFEFQACFALFRLIELYKKEAWQMVRLESMPSSKREKEPADVFIINPNGAYKKEKCQEKKGSLNEKEHLQYLSRFIRKIKITKIFRGRFSTAACLRNPHF